MWFRQTCLALAILSTLIACKEADLDLSDDSALPISSLAKNKDPQWGRFIKRYGATMIPAVLLGLGCGKFCYHMDMVIPWPIDWLIWLGIRHATVDSVKRSMRQCDIEYDEIVFDNTAWISSWIMYIACLKTYGKLHY